jgi:hypothetical protein
VHTTPGHVVLVQYNSTIPGKVVCVPYDQICALLHCNPHGAYAVVTIINLVQGVNEGVQYSMSTMQ